MIKCETCLKRGDYCIAYTEQIEDCIGYVGNKEGMVNMYLAMAKYSYEHGSEKVARNTIEEMRRYL